MLKINLGKITFGKFVPENSTIHKLDPRIKVLISFIFFFFVFFITTYTSLGLLLLYTIFMAGFSSIPLIRYIRSVKSVIIISLVTAGINLFFEIETNFFNHQQILITQTSLKNTIIIFLRLLILILFNSTIMMTTSPKNISDALENILSPLKYLKINVRDIALTITISLKFIPILFEETNKIILSQKARGANFKSKNIVIKIKSFSAIIIPIFISAFKKANDLAISIDSRGYNGSVERTKFNILKLKQYDIIFIVTTILFLTGVVICNRIIKF